MKYYLSISGWQIGTWMLVALGYSSSCIGQTDTFYYDTTLFYTTKVVEIQASAAQNPFAVSTIDRSNIVERTGLTFEPALQQIPGIWMQSGAPNTNRISIRGVGNREPFATSKLKVYLDEMSLTNGIGESSIEDIDPYILEKIEIWKNHLSAFWGAGLGGMIQLTSKPVDKDELYLSTQVGSYGLLNARAGVQLKYGNKDQHSTLLSTQFARHDGYRQNNEYDKQAATWIQRYTTHNWRVGLITHFVNLKAFIPSSLGITAFQENPRQAASNWASVRGHEDYTKAILGINAQHQFNSDWYYKGSINLNRFSSNEVRPFNNLDERSVAIGTRNRILYQPDPENTVSIGFEFFHEKYDWQTFEVLDGGSSGPQLSDQLQNRDHLLLFGHWQKHFSPQLFFVAGASYNFIRQSDDLLPTYTQNAFSPSVGLNYAFPESRFSIATTLGHGFSPISLSDAIGSGGQLDSQLKPETGWTAESTVKYQSPSNGLTIDLTFYHLAIENLLVRKRITEDEFMSINAGKTRHDGIEMSMRAQVSPAISLSTAYTFTRHKFLEFIDGDQDYSGNALTGSPAHTLHALLNYRVNRFLNIKGVYRYISELPITDDNSVYATSVQLFDLGVFASLLQKSKLQIDAHAWLNNIFDARYSSMYQINARAFGSAEPRYYYPGLPRNFRAEIVLRYGLK